MTEIGIIGGGVSGMTAAIAAARLGASVCLFEKTDRVGKKLLATGNGRCNLSNRDMSLSHYHGSCAGLVPAVFECFGPEDTAAFWKELGIEQREQERGKLYPRSLQASSVLDVLRYELQRLNVECLTDQPVQEIRKTEAGFALKTPGGIRRFSRVILAAGGKASPKFGADGSGAALARQLGLRLRPLRPALCRLECRHPELRALMGVKVDAEAVLRTETGEEQRAGGEVLFTETGLSGPPILELSRRAGEELEKGRTAAVYLDLCPEESPGEVFAAFSERFSAMPYKNLKDGLNGWLHKKLIPVVARESGLSLQTGCGSLSRKDVGRLAAVLKEWKFPVLRLAGWAEAQVTVGGVLGEEVTSRLECRKLPGLFLAGEVLDLDGDCGGYNIQWAVSSGYAAGSAAAEAQNV